MQHKEEERSRAGEAKAWKKHIQTLLTIQAFLLQEATQRHIPIMCIN
jgi:2-phosphoglycerate kinase